VASRLLKRARKINRASCPHRLHDRKIKRLYLYVTRYKPSKSKRRQRKVKAALRTLIERAGWIVAICREFCGLAASPGYAALAGLGLELAAYLPAMEKVVAVARRAQFDGNRPEVLAVDKGFCPAEEKYKELVQQVETLAIPRRMRDFVDKVLAAWQAFRAGIEGTISGLKRAFRLVRCFFKGFRSLQRVVGLGVFCHNLIVLAEHEPG